MFSTVRWIVSQIPPFTPDAEVEADIRARCTDARDRGHEIEPDRETEIVTEALDFHRENRRIAEFEAWALKG